LDRREGVGWQRGEIGHGGRVASGSSEADHAGGIYCVRIKECESLEREDEDEDELKRSDGGDFEGELETRKAGSDNLV
jgi:hypothetical protein